ncbi:hypothetical protein [Candidatus Avelusimicrobium fimicolum]|uniref:hypothetical protein n=1 Tax=Candidatus Avelusimicrobium fimicolum TaxID=3416216 RepID=UPI0015B04DC1
MKKMFILCVLSCTLCACNTMHGLRVHNGGLYYNGQQFIGHDDQVKHKVIDKTHAQIKIPVQYQEKMPALPKQLPDSLREALKKYDLNSVGKCTYPGSLTKQTLTLDLNYKQIEGGDEWLILSLLIWPLPLTAPVYIYNYTGIELKKQGEFSIANPFESLNKKNLGVQISYEAEPKEMVLSCDRKSCAVQDKQGNPVNKINIIKKELNNYWTRKPPQPPKENVKKRSKPKKRPECGSKATEFAPNYMMNGGVVAICNTAKAM